MKILKFCLLPLFVVLAAVYLYGYLVAPEDWSVEVSRVIDAEPAELHPWIEDLRRWPEWQDHGEVAYEFSFEGAEKGVGAVLISRSAQSEVRVEVTASDPARGVWFDELLGGEASAKGAIMYEVVPEGTRVTWVDRGSLGDGPILRMFHPMMEATLTKGFGDHLDLLAERVGTRGE